MHPDEGSGARFHRLRVWKCALELASVVYKVTRRFPSEERFGLTAQMRKAAVSVAANVAEGQGRTGPRAYAAFVDIALGSLREVEALAHVARSLGFLEEQELSAIDAEVSKVSPLLVRLLMRLRDPHRGKLNAP